MSKACKASDIDNVQWGEEKNQRQRSCLFSLAAPGCLRVEQVASRARRDSHPLGALDLKGRLDLALPGCHSAGKLGLNLSCCCFGNEGINVRLQRSRAEHTHTHTHTHTHSHGHSTFSVGEAAATQATMQRRRQDVSASPQTLQSSS